VPDIGADFKGKFREQSEFSGNNRTLFGNDGLGVRYGVFGIPRGLYNGVHCDKEINHWSGLVSKWMLLCCPKGRVFVVDLKTKPVRLSLVFFHSQEAANYFVPRDARA
jgi:hypothetical protein